MKDEHDDGSPGTSGLFQAEQPTTVATAGRDRRRIKTENRDVPVETLNHWVERGKLHLQPEFQRMFVWSPLKASRLIESVLLEIPIPVIYVAEEENGIYSVVDGQQRLGRINGFVRGTFPGGGSAFRLSNLKVLRELNGKLFRELSQVHQEAILGASLRLIVITRDSDPDVKFEVFERLNQESVPLTYQELRNCLYRGPYNDLLAELAENQHLRKILGLQQPHRRMLDRQYVLRFLAFWHSTHLKYKTGMPEFLNREMDRHRNADKQELGRMKIAFERAIEMAYSVFGTRAFRRFFPGNEKDPNGSWEGKINAALYDTALYTFSFFDKSQIIPVADSICEEFIYLMTANLDFAKFITTATDSADRVRYRIETWKNRLQALVANPIKEPRCFSRALKKELYDHNPTCALCKQHISELDDAHVDHHRHYWRGGRTIKENARLTHRYCNLARGKRD